MAAYTSPSSISYSGSSSGTSRGSWQDPRDNGPSKGYMLLKDIMVTALPDLDRSTPLLAQLEKAEGYIASSKRAAEFGRPDLSYKDYLRGYDVAVNFIPRHREYGFFCNTKKGWEERYKKLCRSIRDMEGQMEGVRLLIQEDNAKRTSQLQPASPVKRQSISTSFGIPQSVGMNGGNTTTSTGNGHEHSRPSIRPKPPGLHGNVVQAPTNGLEQRFATLRLATGESHDHDAASNGSVQRSSSRPQSLASVDSRASDSPTRRPPGPRDMPRPSGGPSIPPKLPLANTSVPMPKHPSPTYSPVKHSGAPASLNPPRHFAEANGIHVEKRETYYNQPLSGAQINQVQRVRDENPYRPRTPNGVHSAIIAKSSSSDIPHERAISAETLVEYIRKYNVLIVDVRERGVFDEGHIFSKSVLCIEPVALKEGVSAEELEERLVVSPDTEQSLFERRSEFDIVVYHDQNTSDTKFLNGHPTANSKPSLRALYDTLYEFNDYKPLKDGRPPALLLGGVDGWVDLMGSNSLATSNTAVLMGSTGKRLQKGVRRPLGRHRMASANSSHEVRNRRLREYNPLNPDEAQAWRQKAQEEEVDTSQYIQEGSDGEQVEVFEEPEPTSSFVHDYESFLRKFPEVTGVQQSMSMPMPPRQPRPIPQPRYEPLMPPISVPSRPPPAIPRPSYSGQAEIIRSQAPLARQTSALRPPLYASPSIRRMKLPRTGLTNFGVTCYMNSTLQCLSATIPLSQFFLEDRYKNYIQHNWKGSDGIMPDLYANLIRNLWRGEVERIKPTTFRNFCGRMNREWGIDRQQDAKEFFDFLVDCLHEDLNIHWKRTPLRPLTDAEERERERTPVETASEWEWQRFVHRDFSSISSLFAGQHASRLRCTTCGKTSTTYEAFYSISVEIPQSGQGNIYDCLRSYTSEERLSGDEVWKCPYCKCEREATKQIILTRLPQFLVIHFKRFSASKTESARKIHTPIEFPLYGLNMDHYMIHRPAPVITDGEMKADPAITPPFSYDAYGVLRHLGSTGSGGHYISLVKDPGRSGWRRFDDERSYDFEPGKLGVRDRLTNHEAYIVFYQRQVPR